MRKSGLQQAGSGEEGGREGGTEGGEEGKEGGTTWGPPHRARGGGGGWGWGNRGWGGREGGREECPCPLVSEEKNDLVFGAGVSHSRDLQAAM